MKRRITPWLFVLPACAVYALFVLTPIGEAFRLSLFRWRSPFAPPSFCGLEHFADLLRDQVFWFALLHNVLLLVLSLAVQLPIAVGLAVLLNEERRLRTLFRTAFFAPMIMPTAAIAVLWMFLYDPGRGPLTQLVGAIAPNVTCLWLASPGWALLWVFVTICWRHTGFHLVLMMAGIAGIPPGLYEAARIDGATSWHLFRHITLPLLMPMIGVAATLSIIGSLKYFDLVYLMAGGVPEESGEVLATYIYHLAFRQNQGRYGYGSAAAVALFLVCICVILPLQRRHIARRHQQEGRP